MITTSLAELISRALESRISDVWTALPGQIETYDPTGPTADIQPTIKRPVPTEDGDIAHENLPIIPNVPIAFPRGKGGQYAITWPLEPGDHVLLIFTTLPMGQWRTKNQAIEPGDVRLHSLGSCVAIPGLGPDAEPLGGTGSPATLPALVVEGPAIMLGKTATAHAALGEPTVAWIEAIKTALVAAGFPAAPPPPPYATTATILATKTKVE